MAEKKTFKAVQVQDDRSLKIVELETPQITDDEILVKVEAASINPSDVYFIKGHQIKEIPTPHGAGFEGSGTALEVGKNHASRIKIGDKVCFCGAPGVAGTWAQYHKLPGEMVFPMHPDNTLEESAAHFINPVTVVLMLKEIQREGHKAVIHSAGASALGKMMIKLFKEHGIKTINLVRRDDVKEELSKLGADYVLNIKDSDFEKQLEEVIKKEHPTKFYDAIAGDFTPKIFKMMPPKSIISVYGALSGKLDITVNLWGLFADKTLNSFGVYTAYATLSFEEKVKLAEYIQGRLKTTLKSDVAKTFPLEKINEAIAHSEEFASKGKTLIKPWD